MQTHGFLKATTPHTLKEEEYIRSMDCIITLKREDDDYRNLRN